LSPKTPGRSGKGVGREGRERRGLRGRLFMPLGPFLGSANYLKELAGQPFKSGDKKGDDLRGKKVDI